MGGTDIALKTVVKKISPLTLEALLGLGIDAVLYIIKKCECFFAFRTERKPYFLQARFGEPPTTPTAT